MTPPAQLAHPWSQGTLVTWDDDRGFGFVRPAAGGRDVFVHRRELREASLRPAVGQALTYEAAEQPDGRFRVVRVRVPGGRRPGTSRTPIVPRALRVVVPVLVAVVIAAVIHEAWGLWPWTGGVYALMSVVTFMVYAKDKAAARDGRWRVSESTLHLLSLLGGWPGALLAQQVLRHKTIKVTFRTTFWFTVVGNLALLAALCSPVAAAAGIG